MAEEYNAKKRTDLFKIDPRIIQENDYNVRMNFGDIEALAKSIKENGLLNPITVQVVPTDDNTEKYVIVDGARRLRAVKMLIERGEADNLFRIPSLIISRSTSPKDLYVQHIIRNDGKRLTDYEYAVAIHNMDKMFGMSKEEISQKLGIGQDLISRYLHHLERSEYERYLLMNDYISTQTLNRLDKEYPNEKEREKLLKKLEGTMNTPGKKTKRISLKDVGEYTERRDTNIIIKAFKLLTAKAKDFKNEHGFAPQISINEILNLDPNNGDTIENYFLSKMPKDEAV